MAVELAAAYVSIVPTTKGIQGALEKELSPLTGVAGKVGTDSGKALGAGFGAGGGALKAGVGEAEGLFAGFKGKATGALESVGISAGVMKVAGVAGMVEFGLKSVEAFEHTALAARDLGTATGLTIEDASRWIGVAKDMGVNADSLRSGLIKVSKTLDATKWKTYGIDTRDAGGNARSVNDILLDTFGMLGKVTNETERARIGNDLFGKGYATLAPLIGKSRTEYEQMLGSVEKGQVITEGELKKAEAMHHAQAQLKQAFGELTLSIGQQVAALAPLIVLLAKFVGLVPKGLSGIGGGDKGFREMSDALAGLGGEIQRSGHDYDWWLMQVSDGKKTVQGATDELKKFSDTTVSSTDSAKGYSYALYDVQKTADDAAASVQNSTNSTQGYSYAVQDVARSTVLATAATDSYKAHNELMARDVKGDLDKIQGGWDALTGNISADRTWVNLQQSFDDLKVKHKDTTDAMQKGSSDVRAKMLDEKASIDDNKLAVIDYGKNILGLPKSALTSILAEIDRGEYDKAMGELDVLTVNRTIWLNVQIKGNASPLFGVAKNVAGQVIITPVGPVVPAAAAGGFHQGMTLVGEDGPEVVNLPQGSYVHTAAQTRSIMSAAAVTAAGPTGAQTIIVNNNGSEFGVADMNHVLAMARLRS